MTANYPLEGVTVVDLGQIYNGPYCTFLMAMAGARIIKIEAKGGENLRRRGVVGGAALPFAMLNSNKTFATLDLKSARGCELLRAMVKKSDVLVENFKPGAMERMGVGYASLRQINPKLIYGSGSGFGRSGPNKDYPAMDLTVQAMAGIMNVTGFPDRPPVKAGPALCDFSGGVHLFGAIMAALYEREKTGVGRLVEVSMRKQSTHRWPPTWACTTAWATRCRRAPATAMAAWPKRPTTSIRPQMVTLPSSVSTRRTGNRCWP